MDIIRRIDLRVDEQKKYDVIKRLVDENGNKNRAAKELDISPCAPVELYQGYGINDFD